MNAPPFTTTPGPAISSVASATGMSFPLRVFFGHHKCATGWIDSILREMCLQMGLRFKIVHQPYSFEPYKTLGPLVQEEHIQFLAYINANSHYASDLPVYRGFHVVRDPRDIIVSAYYSHLKSLHAPTWNELGTLRNKLARMSKREALFFEMDYLKQQFQEMAAWDYKQDHILELRMEDLTQNPLSGYQRILHFLGLQDTAIRSNLSETWLGLRLSMNRLNHKGRRFMPRNLPMFPVPKRTMHAYPASRLPSLLKRFSFQRMSGGRKPGKEDVSSHYRKGISGDWMNHFETDHIKYFKRNYNDLLLQLGYEHNEQWEISMA